MKPQVSHPHHNADGSPIDALHAGGEARSLSEMMCVLGERTTHLATRSEVGEVATRVAVLEERMSHTATKTWVLGGVVAVLAGVLSGFWWIVQQYLSPLLHAVPHT